MTETIVGASIWEQEIYDHLVDHASSEDSAMAAYQKLSTEASTPALRYLARMILGDETRHHAMMAELADTVRKSAELAGEATPIPDLTFVGQDRDVVLEVTQRFIDVERADLKELKRLAKLLDPVAETTLWGLFVDLMEADTVKHIHVLEFIRDRARHGMA